MEVFMHDFKYRGKELYCEDTPVARIAADVGTPVYVYSYNTLVDHYRKIDKAFASIDHLICYSVKANSNIAVLRALLREGAGLDIVSEGELYRAQKARADMAKIVFAGVGKSASEIEKALLAGILCFTVESEAELDLIEETAERLGKKAPISVRVNPDVDAKTHRYISTGKKQSKFGIDFAGALKMYRRTAKSAFLTPVGVQTHIGSQITSTKPYVQAIRKVMPFVNKIRKEGIDLKFFDIGGGLGIIYDDEKPSTAEEFARAVLPDLHKLGLKVLLEPGRFICGNAGILVCKVEFLKKVPGKTFVIVDAGMNDLIRPSLYDAFHQIVPVINNKKGTVKADIVGPVCESGDFFAKNRYINAITRGELLAIMGAGAYGFTMASNYNSRPRCPEVIVHGDTFFVIRQRESLEQIVGMEKIPNFLN